jgi:hypothetical protein
MKGKANFITILLFCAACYGILPDTTNAILLEIQPIAIKDKNGKVLGIYDESHALVIGVSDYTDGWPKLPGVEKDIILVKDALETKGFNVIVVKNPDSQELENAFEVFIEKYGYKTNNRLLFYFAGHGHTIEPKYGGEALGYIVPKDAPTPYNYLKKFKRVAIGMQRIEEYALSIDAKHALFVFDSCFSGSMFALSRAVPEHISYKTAKPVRLFITSGSADEKVPDTSIFRQQFIAALGGEGDLNGDGYMTGAELSDFVFKNVVNYSKGAQHPQYGKIRNPNLDKGDFVFRIAQPESRETDLSDSTLIEFERQRFAEEKERFESEKRELEQFKLLVMQRRKFEAERADFASQKDILEAKSSSKSVNQQLKNEQLEEIVEERIKVEPKLDETEKLNIQLAKLGVSSTQGVNEIGRDGSFIAYDDGTVLDTKTNLIWWSKSIEADGKSGAHKKSNNFRGGSYSDWRIPSINELKTIYVKSSKHEYKTIDFITLTTPYLISKDFGDSIQSADRSTKFFDFRDGRVVIKDSWNIVYIPSWKCSLLPVRGAN